MASDLVLIGLGMVDIGFLQTVIQLSSGYLWIGGGVLGPLKNHN